MNGLTVNRLDGEFSDVELRAIGATLVGADPEQVCDVSLVVILHTPDKGHDMRVATSISTGPKQVGGMLAHAAVHVYGGCKPCARAKRKGGNSATA